MLQIYIIYIYTCARYIVRYAAATARAVRWLPVLIVYYSVVQFVTCGSLARCIRLVRLWRAHAFWHREDIINRFY